MASTPFKKAELEKVKVETSRTPHGDFVSHHYTLYHPDLPRMARVIATIPYYNKKVADIVVIGNHEDYNKIGVANVRRLKDQIKTDLNVDAVSGMRTGGARIKLGSGPKRVTIKESENHKIEKIEHKKIEDRDNTYHMIKYKVTTPSRNFTIKGWKYDKDKQFYVSDIDGNVGIGSKDYNTVGKTTIRKVAQHIKDDLGVTHFVGQRVGGARRGPARDRNKRYEQTVVKIRERANDEDDDIYHTQDLEEFSQHLIDKHGAHVELYRTPEGHVNLQTLIVPKELRNQGIASNVINDIKKYSNTNKVKIILNAVPLDNSTKSEQLINFYKSHGFVENKGRNKDYRIAGQDTMYRNHKEKRKRK